MIHGMTTSLHLKIWKKKKIVQFATSNMNDKQSNEQQLENNPNEIPVVNDQDHQSDNENFDIFANNPNRNRATNNSNKKHAGSCCCILI